MLKAEKKEALQALFSRMPSHRVSELVTLLDKARQAGDTGIPHDLIMSLLRPSLQFVKPPRRNTPQRIFCNPFEDLLTPMDPRVKEKALIARASLQPVWEWLLRAGGADMSRVCAIYDKVAERGDKEAIWEAQVAIWETAVEVIEAPVEQAYADAESGKKLAADIGGVNRLDDLREMLPFLRIGAEIERLKLRLPMKPIMKLDSNHVGEIKEAYHKIAGSKPGNESWLVIGIMRRLLRDADILKVVRSLSPKGDDTLASMTDLSLVGDVVLQNVEAFADTIEAVAGRPGGAQEVMKLAQEYVGSFKAVTDNLNIKREGEWGQRLLETRKRISGTIDKVVLQSAKEQVLGSLKMRRKKIGRTTTGVADLRSDIDPAEYRKAEERAKAVRETVRIGERIGVSSAARAVVSNLNKELDTYGETLLDQMANVPPEYRKRAKSYVIMAAHLKEILVGPDEADLFRRRALARISGT
ncbi:hypothetical protein [Aestuariispira insulae]|uniref:hypothetical protein n=1 Tax=Aestuariispira insulae TaxID=1461337 RepID=UPI0011C03D29|nr:hypothetical protein [Aestuariispira insulae]